MAVYAPPDRIAIGLRATGEVLWLPFPFYHTLIAGLTGGGKSGLVNSMTGALASLEQVAICGIDLKRVELWPWRGRMTTVAVTPGQADQLLSDLRRLLGERNRLMQKLGLRFWELRLGPIIVVFIDELAEFAAIDADKLIEAIESDDDRLKKSIVASGKADQLVRIAILGSLARLARACGMILVGSTQYPAAEVIDQQIRTQLSLRFMMRVASGEQVKVCLGQGASEGITPKTIGADEPGSFVVVGLPGEADPIKGRAYWVSDEQVAGRVAETAHLRIPPSELFPWAEGGGVAAAVA